MKPDCAITMISTLAQEMKKEGIPVHNLSMGDIALPNHPLILEAAAAALKDRMSPYAPIAGLPELREAATEWMNRRYGSEFIPEQSIVTCGAQFAIYAALESLLKEGDEVLIAAPYWAPYPAMIRHAQSTPVIIATDEKSGWKLTPAALKAHTTPRSRILLFNNATNPTGALYTREEVASLMRAAQEADLMVISDEVYSEIVFDGAEFISCASFPEHRNHTVVIDSCSKNFGMAGWRVGFAFGPLEVIGKMIAVQTKCTSGTSLISQKAALGALRHADLISAHIRSEMQKRRDLFAATYNRLFKTSLTPVLSTVYYFIPIGSDSMKACMEILKKAHVAIVPGIGFGMEGYGRLAFSQDEEEIVNALSTLQRASCVKE